MANRKPDMESPCNGCGTPLSFLRGDPVRAKGGHYHPNCVPSHSPSMDAEYYAGIRDGWQRHQDKQMFGDEYADAADMARELRAEGYAADMPTPPTKARETRPEASQGNVKGPAVYHSDKPSQLAGYDLSTVEGCRDAYRAARDYVVKYSYAGSAVFKTARDFDAAVLKSMTEAGIAKPAPLDWVRSAHEITFHCGRCGGTGRYVTMVENGVPKGPGGECYRCQGKGYQRAADAHRNFWHSNFYMARNF